MRLAALAAIGARVIQLGRIGNDAAVELLTRIVGDDRARTEPQAARHLAELCAGLPLAVCVASARLAARPRWPVSEMAAAMTAERERLAALVTEDDMAVRSALDLSYGALPARAVRMYRLLGLFPGTQFSGGLAAAAAAVPVAEAERLLGALTGASLLDDEAGGQYRFHDLTRLHAREMAASTSRKPPGTRQSAAWSAGTWPQRAARPLPSRPTARADLAVDVRCPPAEPLQFPDRDTALGWLDRELPNVLAVARLAAGAGQSPGRLAARRRHVAGVPVPGAARRTART